MKKAVLLILVVILCISITSSAEDTWDPSKCPVWVKDDGTPVTDGPYVQIDTGIKMVPQIDGCHKQPFCDDPLSAFKVLVDYKIVKNIETQEYSYDEGYCTNRYADSADITGGPVCCPFIEGTAEFEPEPQQPTPDCPIWVDASGNIVDGAVYVMDVFQTNGCHDPVFCESPRYVRVGNDEKEDIKTEKQTDGDEYCSEKYPVANEPLGGPVCCPFIKEEAEQPRQPTEPTDCPKWIDEKGNEVVNGLGSKYYNPPGKDGCISRCDESYKILASYNERRFYITIKRYAAGDTHCKGFGNFECCPLLDLADSDMDGIPDGLDACPQESIFPGNQIDMDPNSVTYGCSIIQPTVPIEDINLIWPTTGEITQCFGEPTPGAEDLHGGIDIAAPEGTAVKAAAYGVVAQVRPSTFNDYPPCPSDSPYLMGTYIVLHHPGLGIYTKYSHMSSVKSHMSVGKQVQSGEIIGYVGNTGCTTGAHLDFRISKTNSFKYDDAEDPAKYLAGGCQQRNV